MSREFKVGAVLFVVALIWISWLFRYDQAEKGILVLDRWTGEVLIIEPKER